MLSFIFLYEIDLTFIAFRDHEVSIDALRWHRISTFPGVVHAPDRDNIFVEDFVGFKVFNPHFIPFVKYPPSIYSNLTRSCKLQEGEFKNTRDEGLRSTNIIS